MTSLVFGSNRAKRMVQTIRRNERQHIADLRAAADDVRSIAKLQNDVEIFEDDKIDAQCALDSAEENLHEARARLRAAIELRDSDEPLPEPEMVIPKCQLPLIGEDDGETNFSLSFGGAI